MRNGQRLIYWFALAGILCCIQPGRRSQFSEMLLGLRVDPLGSSQLPENGSNSRQVIAIAQDLSGRTNVDNRAPGRNAVQPSTTSFTQSTSQNVLVEFAEWIKIYAVAANELDRQQLLKTGEELALQRRAILESLIQTDPRQALDWQVPEDIKPRLSPSIQAHLERHIRSRGDLTVLAALPLPGRENKVTPITRIAVIEGNRYKAFVYGNRAGDPSLTDVPLHGIVLGSLMAVEDHDSESLTLLSSLAVNASSAPQAQLRKLLFIRVDFTNLAGDPLSETAASTLVASVNSFYLENSYGKAGFAMIGDGSDITPTFRMSNATGYYVDEETSNLLRQEARDAARTAGYDLSQYDYDLVCFKRISTLNWAGLGRVGAAGIWINGSFTTGVVAHELGHNLGLGHANFWQTEDYSTGSERGNIKEYGDIFDTMGDATAGQKHFNTRFKNMLNWLPATNVVTVQSNSVHRLWPQDTDKLLGIHALQIPKNNRTNYWVEFRQKLTGNRWLMAGLSLRWASSNSRDTLLLDTTPGSVDLLDDSAIVLGQTFSDYQAGIHITPLAINPTTPPSIEVAVNRGTFPNNRRPVLEIIPSASVLLPGAEARFEAMSSDPDGDSLAYAWDLGDRTFGANQASISARWPTSGLYLVRCSVSDMKGGVTTDSVLIRVGNPSLWTLSGQVLDKGIPLAGIRIAASPSKVTWTDSDGRYILAGLSSGGYNLQAGHDASLFLTPGFTTPLSVRTNLTDLDFLAPAAANNESLTLVPRRSVWRYLDSGEDLGTNWIHRDFDDTGWKSGPGPLGYGNPVATQVGYGPDSSSKYITTYFRHSFTAGSNQLARLVISLLRDDGAVIYLNGQEVARSNMPAGLIRFNTRASSTVSGNAESTYFSIEIPRAPIIPGVNLLAVEIHQANATSSDLVFDMRLDAETAVVYPVPRLSWKRSEYLIELAWPADIPGWRLQSAPLLNPGADWRPLPASPFYREGAYRMRLHPTNSHQFFILDQSP